MTHNLVTRTASLCFQRWGMRTMMSSAARASGAASAGAHGDMSALTPEQRLLAYPKLGNRDIVGFGFNGQPYYQDMPEFPGQAIRFKENSPEIMALREKEKGDWNDLTLAEKKELYRASYCRTYEEIYAGTGEWKNILAICVTMISLSGWLLIYMMQYVYPDGPRTITREWQVDQLKRNIKERQGPIDGISSNYDYENNKWK